MTEQRSDSVIDILRSRLGPRYQSDIEHGRAEITRVLSDELHMDRADAEAMVRRLIDEGQIRYVPGHERDPEVDRDAQYDEHTDQANRMADRDRDADRSTLVNPIPAQGGPQEGYSGLKAGAAAAPISGAAAAPVSGAGTGSPAAGPLAAAAVTGLGVDSAAGSGAGANTGPGYWDIGGNATGVVPSSTRKGQVEPAGT